MYDLDAWITSQNQKQLVLPLEDAEVVYFPNFFPESIASRYFQELFYKTPWRQDAIKLFGKVYQQPRLTALYGLEGKPYSYSSIKMHPKPFEALHLEIMTAIQSVCKEPFTTVLLNLYRDGNDSNGWHSDDEKELGKNPTIASVSFGAKRYFQFKYKGDKKLSYKVSLTHGSLLVMKGSTQHTWLHQLPKSKNIQEPRINLTFRKIH